MRLARSLVGNEIVIYLAASAPVLPPWWSFRSPGTCRGISLGMSPALEASAVYCTDWASGAAVGAIGAYFIGNRGPNTARLTLATAAVKSLYH